MNYQQIQTTDHELESIMKTGEAGDTETFFVISDSADITQILQ